MFFHLHLAKKETYKHNDQEYELVVYRAEEDGHLRGYISLGGFGEWVVGMSSAVASNANATSESSPVDMLIDAMKNEIEAGNFPSD